MMDEDDVLRVSLGQRAIRFNRVYLDKGAFGTFYLAGCVVLKLATQVKSWRSMTCGMT